MEFYRKFGDDLKAIRMAAEEIKAALDNGIIIDGHKDPGEDNRLFNALDKFLDF